jgi:hypothetical protein
VLVGKYQRVVPMPLTPDDLADKLRQRLRGLQPLIVPVQNGFAEAPSSFAGISQDDQRFTESVRLARTFAAIAQPEDRQLLLEIAELIAKSSSR